jgi:Tol biopolymer transport system component
MVRRRIAPISFVAGALVAIAAAAPLRAQEYLQGTVRVSVDSSGAEVDAPSSLPAISADGRFVAFMSGSNDLDPADSNPGLDVFVHDRATGVTEIVSLGSGGNAADAHCAFPAISADGRFVAFTSGADNLVAGDVNGVGDVFVRDRWNGTTELASVDSNGAQTDAGCERPSLSADGRYVVFWSTATTLVAGDTNGFTDIFLHDRQTGATELVSVDSSGVQGDNTSLTSMNALVSADGRYVAFDSLADNLVPGDTNQFWDVFVRDRQNGTTERVSVDSSGAEGNQGGFNGAISADGTCVAFSSESYDLVAGDTNGWEDVFVRDRATGATELVSKSSGGQQGNHQSFFAIPSADGKRVAFQSLADNLVGGDRSNHMSQDFVRDRATGKTIRVSTPDGGGQADSHSDRVVISADGRTVAFESFATNLVAGDTNYKTDVFVRGPWLTLEADPLAPPAGATLAFTSFTGQASAPDLLVITAINGTPTFIPNIFGAFDPLGAWSFSATVPAGLGGIVVQFEMLGFLPTGKLGLSNPVDVAFQ